MTAGFLVWIGSPVLEFVPLEFGGNVIGSIMYIGMGAAVIGGSPVYEAYTSLVTPTVEFWIGGTCEIEGGEGTATDGTAGETTRSLAVAPAVERQLYDLPWFVAPIEGCKKISKCFCVCVGLGGAGLPDGLDALSRPRAKQSTV